MNEGRFKQGISGITDTGQWRLVVELSASGVSAFLKNIDSEAEMPLLLFQRQWESSRDDLLSHIESAVYDNPRLLEDFATHIIVTTPKALWIPAEFMEEDEFDENLFTCVYPAKLEDIRADVGNEEVCLYTLTPGLNSFLQRTLPGSRISSHLSVLKNKLEQMEVFRLSGNVSSGNLDRLYLNLRGAEVDIFVFKNGRFMSGSVHPYEGSSDVAYFALLACHVYGLRPSTTGICLYSEKSDKASVFALLSEIFESVSIITINGSEKAEPISLASAIASGMDCKIE